MSNQSRRHSSPLETAPPGSSPGTSRRFKRRTLIGAVCGGLALVLAAAALALAVPKWQARRALAARDPERALAWLEWAAKVAPRDPEAAFLRARAYRRQGRFDLVHTHLGQAWNWGWPIPRIRREEWLAQAQAGQLREAEPHLQQLLMDPQDDASEICAAYVNGFYLMNRYPDALRLIEPWIADFPNEPQAFLMRGKILRALQNFKAAETDLRRAFELAPHDGAAGCELAGVLLDLKQPAEALEVYRRCDGAGTVRARVRIGQAECLRMLGESDQARAILQDLLAAEPRPAEAIFELGQLELEAGHYEAAVRALQEAHRKLPRDLKIRYALANALRSAGQTREAAAEFAFVTVAQAALSRANSLIDEVAAHPDRVEARAEVGRIFLKYADPNSGLVWLQGALNYDPRHRPSLEALAAYYEGRAAERPEFKELARGYRLQLQQAVEAQ
jgi:tetratricopeptide (TPR) repeat protein